MKAILLKVNPPKKSTVVKGGIFIFCIFKDLVTGIEYPFYCYSEDKKSFRFHEHLKPQTIFDNLSIIMKDGKEFIDGRSDFKIIPKNIKNDKTI